MTPLILAVTLAASAATATTPAPPTDEYVLLIGAETIGTESATRATSASGDTLTGTAEVTTPQGTVRFTQTLERKAGKVARYEVTIAAGPSSTTIRALQTGSGWKLEASQAGVLAPPTVVERPAAPPTVVLDNNLASHIDLLTRSLTVAPGAKLSMTAAVPQAMQVLPFELARLDDAGGTRRYRLTMASVLIEIAARREDGALLEARVPLQNATYRRKGWEPPKAEAAARDPRERDTVVPSPAGDLPAVIVVPKSDKPPAAVLLLSGSGPNDRDETIGPNKPLRDIALALADRGIASLRFDKRTRAFPGASTATLAAEYLDDAGKALEILRGSAGVDPKRVFVAGHSLGGTVAPFVAARAKDAVRGLVLLAPGVRRLDRSLVEQVTERMRASGIDEATVKAQVGEIEAALERALDPANTDTSPVLGAPPAYWREVAALDVSAALGATSLPFLVVQGDKDIQVKPDLDFEVLRAKLGDAGGRATYKLLPGLNHLFMKVDGASTGAEYAIAGHVAPEVVETVAAWVVKIAP